MGPGPMVPGPMQPGPMQRPWGPPAAAPGATASSKDRVQGRLPRQKLGRSSRLVGSL